MNDPRTCVYGQPRKFGAMGTLPSCTRPRGACLCGLKRAQMQGTETGRMHSHTPHFEELPRGNRPKINLPPDLPPGEYVGLLAQLDYGDVELRVLASGCIEAGVITPEAWAKLGRCPWDDFKPGRDVA